MFTAEITLLLHVEVKQSMRLLRRMLVVDDDEFMTGGGCEGEQRSELFKTVSRMV